MRKSLYIALILILLFSFSVQAVDSPVYDSYTYTYWGEPVEAPESYHAVGTILAQDVGLNSFKEPKDLYVDNRGHLFVADTGNNRVVELDENNALVREIVEFTEGASVLTMKSPSGIFVKGNGNLLIADTENKRVIEVDSEERIVQEYRQPHADVNFSGIDFLPTRVLADSRGFVYVLCDGLYQGAVSYDSTGKFLGYFGTNRIEVTLEVLANQFWKSIMTQEQISKMQRTVPEEFTSFDIDGEGFIYTCTELSENQVNQIKRINPKGVNVMQPNLMINEKYQNKFGDLEIKYYQGELIQSRFVDVSYYEHDGIGYINCLDFTKGRVFQYTVENSNLICIFGGTASQIGTFRNAAAIDNRDDTILVLDSSKNSITIFEPTQYLQEIHRALAEYEKGNYDTAQNAWEAVLSKNSNLELAYTGIGNIYYNKKDYITAMEYYRRGYSKSGYAKALKYYRKDLINQYFPVALTLLVVIGVTVTLWIYRKPLRKFLTKKH